MWTSGHWNSRWNGYHHRFLTKPIGAHGPKLLFLGVNRNTRWPSGRPTSVSSLPPSLPLLFLLPSVAKPSLPPSPLHPTPPESELHLSSPSYSALTHWWQWGIAKGWEVGSCGVRGHGLWWAQLCALAVMMVLGEREGWIQWTRNDGIIFFCFSIDKLASLSGWRLAMIYGIEHHHWSKYADAQNRQLCSSLL
jgi:hypothetical protein